MPESSSRTLIVGIDDSGFIVQCGQSTRGVLGRPPEEILGCPIGDLIADTAGERECLEALLEAARSGQERTAMLALRRAGDAVVTVQPMVADKDAPAALVLIRVPLPAEERFLDPALIRQAMLGEALTRMGSALDLDQTTRAIVDVVVPWFCNLAELLLFEDLVVADEFPTPSAGGGAFLRRLAIAVDDDNPAWSSAFPTGEVLIYPRGTPYFRCLQIERPVLEATLDADSLAASWRRPPVAKLFSGASMVLLPLIARQTMLGFIVCVRKDGYRRFDAYDVEIGMEYANRVALFVDNARRLSRERATALTLQRSLLPTGLSAPSSVEVGHRYLPASTLIEVGGDWYESIALPGARVALVVGDVAGHGVRAAVTMGRLRTALHTLANLEFPPAEALLQLDDLMRALGEREPHFATCVYAVYDAVSGCCEIASAGHLPPLLVRPNGENELLDVPPAPPLGTGEGPIESREFTIEDGSLLVLYTDGLVENRIRDIDDGLLELRRTFGADAPTRSLEDLCKASLNGVYDDHHRDDIAVLIARLRRIPADRHVTWTLPGEAASVRRARGLVRDTLKKWDLNGLSATTELLASELATNALRYAAAGQITLRLLLERTLVCEVLDRSAALPRLRCANAEDENGRGLQVVSQLAQRWGTRRTATGKVVWCEQSLPVAELARVNAQSARPWH